MSDQTRYTFHDKDDAIASIADAVMRIADAAERISPPNGWEFQSVMKLDGLDDLFLRGWEVHSITEGGPNYSGVWYHMRRPRQVKVEETKGHAKKNQYGDCLACLYKEAIGPNHATDCPEYIPF